MRALPARCHRAPTIFKPLLICCVAVACAGGCQGNPPVESHPLPPGSTYLIHLPGVAGDAPLDRWWMAALEQGGAVDHVQLYDWTCHDPWLGALHAQDRNHRQAAKVASLIARRCRSDPSAKVILSGESGGAAVALWTLERLPPHMSVQDLVLIAPAVSPRYDLTAALRHVRGRAYIFTSANDVVICGAGTRLFGTMDGKNTDAAGLVGFHRPAGADPAEYRKLIEMRYRPAWLRYGNFGDHTGALSPDFARNFIAPLLRASASGVEVAHRQPAAMRS